MLIDAGLSREVERAIAQSHIAYTQVASAAGIPSGLLRLGGGVACFSGVDSPLSQVVGWGFEETHADLPKSIEAIEQFYRDNGMATCPIELSPLAGAWIGPALVKFGYRLAELSMISVLDLATFDVGTDRGNVVIDRAGNDGLVEWARVVCRGFETDALRTLFEHYAQADNIHVFLARMNGTLCGGGTIGIHEGICDLGLTSVLPAFRGRGVQRALLDERLRFAQHEGARLASVTTEPGSVSDRNVQRAGFRPAYTRMKLQKPLV